MPDPELNPQADPTLDPLVEVEHEDGVGPVAFPIAAIGASAGGLEAFGQLLSQLPASPGLALVLIQHLDPHHASMLSSLLKHSTSLPVREATDGALIERDHIYVIPPNTSLWVEEGRLRLGPRREELSGHMPIDLFCRSLAAWARNRAIGVVLSGGGTDGTLGLAAIKGEGGMTFAQDRTAKQFSMPRSAINEGVVDVVLDPGEIGRRLCEISRHPFTQPLEQQPAVVPELEKKRDQVLALLLRETGVDFTQYKRSTIHRRIERRMALEGIESLNDYVQRLQQDAAAVHALYHDMLIRVTSFFRDGEAYQALQNVLPNMVRNRNPTAPVRIWVAGCSTGEEAYSVAIAVLEVLGDSAANAPIKILATDISENSLTRARSGIYPENIELDVSPERLRRFFNRIDGHYQIAKPVRDLCVFARHNLTCDPPFSHMDLVTCRNVMIYLDAALHRKVLRTFHYALKGDGVLMLGQSEGVGALTDLFAAADEKHKLFCRRGIGATHYDPPLGDSRFQVPDAVPRVGVPPLRAAWGSMDIQREADRVLLSRFAPAGVLVDENLVILQFRGNTSDLVAPTPGMASLELLRFVRDELKIELRSALAHAKSELKPVRRPGLRYQQRGELRTIDLEVVPVRLQSSGGTCFWVLFHSRSSAPEQASESPPPPAPVTTAADDQQTQLQQLREELEATQAISQSLAEEHEATSEELKSAHEEVLSSNEELLSMNEELQTAKEEMQSANEELATLNEELKHRNADLGKVNDDLLNLLGSVDIPIIMVSRSLAIRRFTPKAERLLQLIPSDVGRPITDIRHHPQLSDFEELLQRVITQLVPEERQVQDVSGNWWALRIRPYVTQDNKIDGATIVALDIDAVKRNADREIEQVHALAAEQTARAKAELDNRMKDEFLAMLAHELRNPLAPVMTSIDILRHQISDLSAPAGKTLDMAERQITHMSRLLDDLLDVSRITHRKIQLRKERFDLTAALEQAIEITQPYIEQRQLKFETELPDEPIRIEADPTRFEQIVVNLLNNAVKYTPAGGQVSLKARRENGELIIHVRDSGIGIAADVLPRIFDLFVQADQSLDRARGGLGIGLTLVRRLAELHGGSVHAASGGPGQGSEFTVRLPLNTADSAEVAALVDFGQSTGPLRVLVVDDMPDATAALALLLTGMGHEVRAVHSGHAALQTAVEFNPQAVLLDIGLPELDGYEVARRLRQIPGLEQVLIVAMTGYGQEHAQERSRQAGFDFHFVKPVPTADLQRALATVKTAERS